MQAAEANAALAMDNVGDWEQKWQQLQKEVTSPPRRSLFRASYQGISHPHPRAAFWQLQKEVLPLLLLQLIRVCS